jgi:hypothetical protein
MIAAGMRSERISTTWIQQIQGRRRLLGIVALLLFSLALARLVLFIDVGAVGLLVVTVGVAVVIARPRVGLYAVFGIVFFFDTIYQDPFMTAARFFYNSLQTTLRLTGAILLPYEMALLLIAVAWLAQGAMRRKLDFEGGAFGRIVLLFTGALLFGWVRGVLTGGNFNYVMWESRSLFSLVLAYVLTTNLVRTRGHIRTLTTLMFVLGGLAASEGIFRRYVIVNSGVLGDAQESWFSHESVVLWGVVVIIAIAQQVVGAPRWQRLIGPPLMFATLLGMLVTERRAGLVALFVALAFFILSLFTIKRKAFFAIGIPALILAGIYLPLFWNSGGTLGQGARAVRSISSPDPRDAASNAWRDLEAINVRATIASDPIFGIGFGKPFLQIVAVPDISFFEFWNYEAHHNILWVWMKTGGIGFIIFFSLILGVIARSVWLARVLPEPELKVFAVGAMAGVLMSVIFLYVDLGLGGVRIPLLLGVASGGVGVLDRLRTTPTT